jgi:hypothetical protein
MKKYTEGRLRKFILLHYRKRFPPQLLNMRWHPIGVGIHVPKSSNEKGGSIDILFMNHCGKFLIAEVKRREDTRRGREPVEQVIRYCKGIREYKPDNFDSFVSHLKERWEGRRKPYKWVKKPSKHSYVSARFEKAMRQLFGSQWEMLLRRAFTNVHRELPLGLVIQNGKMHKKTRGAIKADKSSFLIGGVEVTFPYCQKGRWTFIEK